jgi:hypothetical protein
MSLFRRPHPYPRLEAFVKSLHQYVTDSIEFAEPTATLTTTPNQRVGPFLDVSSKLKDVLSIIGRSSLECFQKQRTLAQSIADFNPGMVTQGEMMLVQVITSSISESARLQAETSAEMANLAVRLMQVGAGEVTVEFGDADIGSDLLSLTRVISEDSLVLPIMEDGFTIVGSIASDSSDDDQGLWPILDTA